MGRVTELRKQPSGEADVFPQAEGNTTTTIYVRQVVVALPESKSSARLHMSLAREPGDLEGALASAMADVGQVREERIRNPHWHAFEESDALVVSKKSAKTRVTLVESMEKRSAAKGKLTLRNAGRMQGRETATTDESGAGKEATGPTRGKYTNLLCHLKVPQLREAYQSLRKDAAVGADGITWDAYGQSLDARLTDLQDRIHRGSYVPQPVRRIFIPKADGRKRPLGIPSVEDKIVQQAVRRILEPIYEREFVGFSYGFRPGRSAHNALDALATVIVKKRVNWVLDADIQNFFDTIDHGWLKKFIEHRIGDTRLVRLLMKWLKAGVMVEGKREDVQAGTPQGGIISPLLANIYLHYVLDLWVHAWRKRNARQEVYVVRYADDFVVGFEDGRDARDFRAALSKRLSAFELTLHETKTRVLRFGRYARERSEHLGVRVETFDFLGFTHISGSDRKNGWFQLKRITSRKKRQATLAGIRERLRRRRHEDAGVTHAWLEKVLRGYDGYFAVPTNERVLERMRHHIFDAWLAQLERRAQRIPWSVARIKRFKKRFPLPNVITRHPWPEMRFLAR
jgi:RNA-directed DNA polymerase